MAEKGAERMDLHDNAITIGELIKNDQARKILQRRFPSYTSPLMLTFARGMRLAEVLKLAEGRVAPEDVEAALRELEEV